MFCPNIQMQIKAAMLNPPNLLPVYLACLDGTPNLTLGPNEAFHCIDMLWYAKYHRNVSPYGGVRRPRLYRMNVQFLNPFYEKPGEPQWNKLPRPKYSAENGEQ